MAVSSTTGLLVILGDPVRRTLSPVLHNAAFHEQGLDLAYLACRVEPDTLPEAVAGLHALGAIGGNVTIPHKEAICEFVHELSPEAKAIGAVNTLVRTEQGWRGHNTDVAGFLEPLADADLEGAEMTVLGAGGAARAVVYGLLSTFSPSRLTIASRRIGQAEALASAFTAHDARGGLRTAPLAEAPPAQIVVNCTPLGMVGMEDLSAYRGTIGHGQIAYDLVYRPQQTRFLLNAQSQGAETIGGFGMLLGQAAEAYRLWTGRDMPIETARQAALDALASD